MGLIKDTDKYIYDTSISVDDYILGSDAEATGQTKNYLLGDLATFFSDQIGLGTAHQGYSESGTRALNNLIVTVGDYDDSGNGTRMDLDLSANTINFLGGGHSNILIANELVTITNLHHKANDIYRNNNDDFSLTLSQNDVTAARTVTWQDKSGAIALTSDLPSVFEGYSEIGTQAGNNLDVNLGGLGGSFPVSLLLDQTAAFDGQASLSAGSSNITLFANPQTINLTAANGTTIANELNIWNGSFSAQIQSDLLTTGRTFQFPNYTGTLTTEGYVDNSHHEGSVVTTTAGYTLLLSDGGTVISIQMAGLGSITVPPNSSVAFPTYTKIILASNGAGNCLINEGVGVTIDENVGGSNCDSNEVRTLIKVSTDGWVLGN